MSRERHAQAERSLRHLNARFAKVSRRQGRSRQFSIGEWLVMAGVFGAIFVTSIVLTGAGTDMSSKPWTPQMQANHLAARQGCAQAQSLGLTPAYRGEPGYWPEWDGDGDGISCERW